HHFIYAKNTPIMSICKVGGQRGAVIRKGLPEEVLCNNMLAIMRYAREAIAGSLSRNCLKWGFIVDF
ncbi:MAG: hypothetical protein ACD_64C00282G0001, partial [uncultured bacterium]